MFNLTRTCNHLNSWTTDSRQNVELLMFYRIIQDFAMTSALEIGVHRGRSSSAIIEALPNNAHYTGVDIDYKLADFWRLFDGIQQNKTVEFVTCNSVEFSADRTYDFILVDGDHSTSMAVADMITAKNHSTPNTIIALDDYAYCEVAQAIELLQQDTHFDFEPFLQDDTILYYKHVSKDVSEWLDNTVTDLFDTIGFGSENHNSVLKVNPLGILQNNTIFQTVCRELDL